MKILILGSHGIVGSGLIKYLKDINCDIIEWDIKMGQKYDLCDDNNYYFLENTIKLVDFVYFLAYDVGGAKYISVNDIQFLNNNIKIMLNVFTLLHKYKKKFIFASSQMSNMYDNIYGSCKHIGEHYTKMLNGLIVRLWNVYGYEKASIKSHVITDFINMANKNSIIKMRTNGKEKRQLLYNEDCGEVLYILLIQYDNFIEEERYIIDITSFEWISIYELAKLIKKIYIEKFNKNVVIIKGEKEDDTHIKLNIPNNYIQQYWKPKISLEDGIKKSFFSE